MCAFIKDFNGWNFEKKKIEKLESKKYFKEGEIWWCNIGVNVQEESCGKGRFFRRPVIIIKKLSGRSCVVCPTTTQKRDGSWYYKIHLDQLDRWVMMHQVRFISASRLTVRESTIPDKEFIVLKKSLSRLLGLSDGHGAETPISG